MQDETLERLKTSNAIKLFGYREQAIKQIKKFGASKEKQTKDFVKVQKEIVAYCDPKLKYDKLGSSMLLKAVHSGYIKSLKAIEKHVKWIKCLCLRDLGFPAKPYLFNPVLKKADDKNGKVWPSNLKGDKDTRAVSLDAPYRFVQGQEYYLPDDNTMINTYKFEEVKS